MKRTVFLVSMLLLLSVLAACSAGQDAKSGNSLLAEPSSVAEQTHAESTGEKTESETLSEEREPMRIQITVDDTTLTAIPEENSSAEAFLALLQEGPVTIQMADYVGMEKVGPLGTNLPRNDTRISVDAGDVILYQGNQITIYYGTNTWSFTKLATIENATKQGLLEVLGTEDVEVTFSLAQ